MSLYHIGLLMIGYYSCVFCYDEKYSYLVGKCDDCADEMKGNETDQETAVVRLFLIACD